MASGPTSGKMDQALIINLPQNSSRNSGRRGSWRVLASAENLLLAPWSASAQLGGFCEGVHCMTLQGNHIWGWDSVGHFDSYRSCCSQGAYGGQVNDVDVWLWRDGDKCIQVHIPVTLVEWGNLGQVTSPLWACFCICEIGCIIVGSS